MTSTAICGSDLHILNGFIPQKNDLVLGHEFMGIVEETGADVRTLKRGDRVVVPFQSHVAVVFSATLACRVTAKIPTPKKYGPEGGLLDQKGGELFGYTNLYFARAEIHRPINFNPGEGRN